MRIAPWLRKEDRAWTVSPAPSQPSERPVSLALGPGVHDRSYRAAGTCRECCVDHCHEAQRVQSTHYRAGLLHFHSSFASCGETRRLQPPTAGTVPLEKLPES